MCIKKCLLFKNCKNTYRYIKWDKVHIQLERIDVHIIFYTYNKHLLFVLFCFIFNGLSMNTRKLF